MDSEGIVECSGDGDPDIVRAEEDNDLLQVENWRTVAGDEHRRVASPLAASIPFVLFSVVKHLTR
jgi:hypothetical protein